MNNQLIKIKNQDGSTLTLEVSQINYRLQNGSLSWGKCGRGEHMLTFLPLRSKIFAYYGVLPSPKEKKASTEEENAHTPATKASAFTRINKKGNEVHDYGSLVDGLPQLPTLPHIVVKLAEQTGDPHKINLKKVESYIREDQSITTHVLKMANKARFMAHGKAKTMKDAIQLLGFEKIKRVAIASGFLGKFLEDSPETFEWSEFWKHAIGVGIVSSLICKSSRPSIKSAILSSKAKPPSPWEACNESTLPAPCFWEFSLRIQSIPLLSATVRVKRTRSSTA